MKLSEFFRTIYRGLLRVLSRIRAWIITKWSDKKFKKRSAAGIGIILIAVLAFSSLHRVREGEIGVVVNNLTGSLGIEERAGYRLLIPGVYSFHLLDRRVQSMTMAEHAGQGFGGGDAVKIKTSDGSNVALDIQVTYRIIPQKADVVLSTAGPGTSFGELWIRSAVRSGVAEQFGRLTTEQVYNASMRTERAKALVESLNLRMNEHGIEIVTVVPQDFRFYKEYEEIIKQKKLADQEVEEQQAKARLAKEEQQKKVTVANLAARAKLATVEGEADRIRAEADGYVRKVHLQAEANLIRAEKKAAGLLAVGLAEATGLKEAARAVSGIGGVNLVSLEYASQLGKIKFKGVPVVQDGRMGQYRIHSAPVVGEPAGKCTAGSCGVVK